MTSKNELKGIFFLVGAAFIWGIALVAQKAGTESLGPFSFIAIRTMMGAITMVPIFLFFDRKKSEEQHVAEHHPKLLLCGAFACSLVVTIFMVCQQVGIAYTTVGKGGFITALYIILEPAKASLALSSETIFTMLAGMVFFQEVMTVKEYIGCALIFIAIIFSQLEPKKKNIN